MKKNKTVIVASESEALFTSRRLLIESRKLKYSTVWLNPYQHLLSEKKNRSMSPEDLALYFHRTSGVRYDDFDLLVSSDHALSGHKVTNPLESLKLFRDKDLQYMFLKKHALPCIPSISYRGKLKENYWDQITSLNNKGQFVLKMSRGNQGIGVNLINGEKSLQSLLETFHAMKDQRFLIQPYIPHKKEYRIFVIKSEIVAIVERTLSSEDFRGNSKRSSKARILSRLNSDIRAVTEKVIEHSGLDYFGMDVLIDKLQFYILEINAVPGFEQIEELTGINIARELLLKSFL